MALVSEFTRRLRELPRLPAKFGFAIDTGAAAILGTASADIRLERSSDGLLLRADGMGWGERVDEADAISRVIDLAHWFVAKAGGLTRMAYLVNAGARPDLRADTPPLTTGPLAPGGRYRAIAFGRINAETFHAFAIAPLRLTPWRGLVVEGDTPLPVHDDLIADPADPRLRVAVCVGKPRCPSASVETFALARRLSADLPEGRVLHVSGCAKGCAHPGTANFTLTGRDGRFDLILNGKPADLPLRQGIRAEDISDRLKDIHAAQL